MQGFNLFYSQAGLAYLQQSEDRESKNEQGEADHGVEPGRNLLSQPNEPAHVKSLGEHHAGKNAVLLQPRVGFGVNELETVKIFQEPLTDLTAPPGNGE